ncbi:MAG: NrpR regulatory domain-containing protein [Dehalococcoidia bacterium]
MNRLIGQESQEVERKVISILQVLSDSQEPLGARVVGRLLKGHGIELSERAVRYHLKIMDERGLTQPVGRTGRVIAPLGAEELKNALVGDKVGFIISKIELLAFQTTFDWTQQKGQVPVNISFFPREKFSPALKAMRGAFEAGFCVSHLVSVASEGERVADIVVPRGMTAMATVCSIIINGALLRAGVPMDSRFGGILQVRGGQPLRFVDLIHYSGSSMDPSEIFIMGRMTSVGDVVRSGDGKLLANFREIPAACRSLAESVLGELKGVGLGGLLLMGETGEPVCQIPVTPTKIGMVLMGGLNPVAAAAEGGIEVANTAMGGLIDYGDLVSFWDL